MIVTIVTINIFTINRVAIKFYNRKEEIDSLRI